MITYEEALKELCLDHFSPTFIKARCKALFPKFKKVLPRNKELATKILIIAEAEWRYFRNRTKEMTFDFTRVPRFEDYLKPIPWNQVINPSPSEKREMYSELIRLLTPPSSIQYFLGED